MIINVCGKKVSTVNAGWLGLILSALVIFPCLIALVFADSLARRIMEIPDVNCRMSYDEILRDMILLCRVSILMAGLSMAVSCCLILELERHVTPVAWRRYNSTRVDSVFIFNIPESAVTAEVKPKKSEKLEKSEKTEKSEKAEKAEKPEISIV